MKRLFASKKGAGLGESIMDLQSERLSYWNDSNELCDRLRLLLASQQEGYPSHKNKIAAITEELREENILY